MRYLIIPEYGFAGDLDFTPELVNRLSIAAPSLKVFPIGTLVSVLHNYEKDEGSEMNLFKSNSVLLHAFSGLLYEATITPEDAHVDIIIGILPKSFPYKFDKIYAINKSLVGLQIQEVEKIMRKSEIDNFSPFYTEEDVTFTGTMEEIVLDIQRSSNSLLGGERE